MAPLVHVWILGHLRFDFLALIFGTLMFCCFMLARSSITACPSWERILAWFWLRLDEPGTLRPASALVPLPWQEIETLLSSFKAFTFDAPASFLFLFAVF